MAKRHSKKASVRPSENTNQPADPSINGEPIDDSQPTSGAVDLVNESTFPIVGIVASAGGLDSFKSFFRAIKEN
jgi:chemotaxis response regulator CheB